MRTRARLADLLDSVNWDVATPDLSYREVAKDIVTGVVKALRGELENGHQIGEVLEINLSQPKLFESEHVRELLHEAVKHLRCSA